MNNFIRWCVATVGWLWAPRLFWLTLVVLAIAIGTVVLWPWGHEQGIKFAGLGLQIAGLATVAWGVRKTRTLFGRPTLFGRAKRWLGSFPRCRPRTLSASVQGIASAALFGSARVRVNASKDATLEQRIGILENNFRLLDEEVARLGNEIREGIKASADALTGEVNERIKKDDELRDMLDASETGGLDISAMDLVWLAAGVIASTASQELAQLLSGLFAVCAPA